MVAPAKSLLASALTLVLGCSAADPGESSPISEPTTSHREDAGVRDAAMRDAGKLDAASRPPTVVPTTRDDAGTSDPSRPSCDDGKHEDVDGDGFTRADGDCNDCLKTTNPAAFDIPGNDVDEDCSGDAATSAECDEALDIASTDAKDGARALGLCNFADADARGWGVTAARYTDANGVGKLDSPLAVGLLPTFGAAKPRAGGALLVLSSGVARAPGQAGYTKECDDFVDNQGCGLLGCEAKGATPPAGYPKQSSTCKASDSLWPTGKAEIFNQAALELKVRVPSNASAFSFESSFYTSEYPEYICEVFNDFFVVFKEPKPADLPDSNILFDANKDTIGVNTGLLAVCDADAQRRRAVKTFTCEQGTDLLRGTGYGAGESACGDPSGGGSTGWLKTTAPVKPGETITLRFAIWDTTDAALDSSALLDHFTWITFVGEPEKDVPIETEPVPLI